MLDQKTKAANEMIMDGLPTSGGRGFTKQASDALNGYIRLKIMEDGFMRKILPSVPITNDELSESLTERKPWKIIEIEPNSVGATTVQFGTVPDALFMEGKKIPVYFNRIVTAKYTKDVDELRTWRMDIRQILCDQQTKWMHWEEDRRFIHAVDTAIQASVNTSAGKSKANPYGLAVRFDDGYTRANLIDALGLMERTPNHLTPSRALMNTTTAREIQKWTRESIGGDMAQDLLFNGYSSDTIQGVEFIRTIKNDLVPDGRMYMFADPKFLGKHYMLYDATMYVENKAWNVEWFQYKCSGAVIGNIAAVAVADFNPRGLSDSMTSITF